MKHLILLASLFLSSQLALGASKSISVKIYRFTDTLSILNKDLEKLFIKEIQKICTDSSAARIINPKFILKMGEGFPDRKLEGVIDLNDIDSGIIFRSHPYASLTADVICTDNIRL